MNMDSLELILQELKKINGRLDGLDSKVSGLERKVDKLQTGMDERKEAREITRDGVNALLEWPDKISEAQRLPFPKI